MGRELLPVARGLVGGGGTPDPRGRSAVNRAYYAAFGEADDYVTARGFVRRAAPGSHNQVWRYLETGISDGDPSRRASRRAIAAQGLFLKHRRQKADYRRGSMLGKTEPQDAVDEADRIIKALDNLIP